MKKIILSLILICMIFISYSQFPYNEEFNPGTTWTFTNGAGIQNYGGFENYATTNIGNTVYPNSSTITITSPNLNLTTCLSGMTVSFNLSGIIETNYDFLYFEYKNNLGVWVIVQLFTNTQNANFSYITIPNTATQFRFRLVTDSSVNRYCTFFHPIFGCLSSSPYYYDIRYFNITCNVALPIVLEYFEAYNITNANLLQWKTASEYNNDYFQLEWTTNPENLNSWEKIGTVNSKGESGSTYSYAHKNYTRNSINYYRLTQVDYDGNRETFDIRSVDNTYNKKEVLKVVNSLGQIVDINTKGVLFIIYTDGKIERIVNY